MSRNRADEHAAPQADARGGSPGAPAAPAMPGARHVSDAPGTPDAPNGPDMSDGRDMAGDQEIIGVVLAGGLSTRLGQDKTRLHLHGDAAPDMLARTAELVRSVTGEVWISCRHGGVCPAGADGSYYRLADELEGMGPFGGVITALRVAQGPVLVLSCDLPFMERAVLERLLARRAARRPGTVMTTFRQEETGFIESLVAVYEFGALPLFRRALEEGERKLSRVVPPDLREHIPYSVREALPFFNINYPADLEMARRIIGSL